MLTVHSRARRHLRIIHPCRHLTHSAAEEIAKVERQSAALLEQLKQQHAVERARAATDFQVAREEYQKRQAEFVAAERAKIEEERARMQADFQRREVRPHFFLLCVSSVPARDCTALPPADRCCRGRAG